MASNRTYFRLVTLLCLIFATNPTIEAGKAYVKAGVKGNLHWRGEGAGTFIGRSRTAPDHHQPTQILDNEMPMAGDVIRWHQGGVVEHAVILDDGTVQALHIKEFGAPNELFVDESSSPVPLQKAMETIQQPTVLDVYFTQRMVEDRVHNPHGEHAEDCWLVLDDNTQDTDRL
ncbi:hypothetical protein AAMO2058_000481000 [Amorphochlora amoebiformis]